MVCERKSLKKPEATGSAGRCEPGRGRLTAPSLCPACESHPFPGRQMWFSQLALYGAEFGLLGIGSGTFPTQAGNPAHRPSQPRETRCFSEGKNGCCAPEGFSGSSRRLGLAHGGQQEGSGWTAAGCEKAAAGSCWAAALGFMIAFAGNFQFLPHPPARTGTWPAGSPPTP